MQKATSLRNKCQQYYHKQPNNDIVRTTCQNIFDCLNHDMFSLTSVTVLTIYSRMGRLNLAVTIFEAMIGIKD